MMLAFAIATTSAIAVWSALSIWMHLRRRRARPVPDEPSTLPSVSIIFTALDEESTIEPAIRSLIALDYPDLEIVAVNDRSSDATPGILDRIASESPLRLRVVHNNELPAGWLGKCHALDLGAQVARGEFLLFTDADVVFEPGSLRVAMAHRHTLNADHMVFAPQLVSVGYVEDALLALFGMSLSIAFRFWAIESPSIRSYAGFGGFNMVRRTLYDAFGGHRTLRMEVADDMKLGLLAKKYGGRSTLIDSEGMVRVRWREGARDVVRGLERSGFAGIDYSWSSLVASTLFFVGVMLAPYALIFASDARVQLVAAASIVMLLLAYGVTSTTRWVGALHPVACALFVWAFVRSAVITTRNGGLAWRGTFYSIEDLKRGTVR